MTYRSIVTFGLFDFADYTNLYTYHEQRLRWAQLSLSEKSVIKAYRKAKCLWYDSALCHVAETLLGDLIRIIQRAGKEEHRGYDTSPVFFILPVLPRKNYITGGVHFQMDSLFIANRDIRITDLVYNAVAALRQGVIL